MQNYFTGKVCVVTGAASGLGLEISRQLLACGAIVFMADADAGRLERARAEAGGDAHAAVTDVTREEEVRALVEHATGHKGRLDAMFNNAGVGESHRWEDLTLDCWHAVMDVNFWGVVHGLHHAVPVMRRQGYGHIVITSSAAGLAGIPFQTVYSCAKAAIASIGESLRCELADENIRVTTVYPGNVATPIFAPAGAVPEDAIPVQEAVRTILDAAGRGESTVIFPEHIRLWNRLLQCDPEYREKSLLEMARERRRNIEARGRYF